jgi:GNAT superfamily N-acetyltransferase
MTAVDIRAMTSDELDRVVEIDVSEEGEVNYRVVDGRLEVFPRRHRRPPLSADDWREDVDEWRTVLEDGGEAFGAFVGARLVGIGILRPGLTEDMSQLAALYVDRAHRRMGVGRALVEHAEARARAAASRRLYVSATPSDSAVPFYLGQGFSPVADPHPALLALEPDDIHMAKWLGADERTPSD